MTMLSRMHCEIQDRAYHALQDVIDNVANGWLIFGTILSRDSLKAVRAARGSLLQEPVGGEA
jgi:hypothetical protein